MTIEITPGAVWAMLAAYLLVHLGWTTFNVGLDDSDKDARNRSGAAVITDHKTGLQYLRAPGGGITPRLDVDGKHMLAPSPGQPTKEVP